MRDGAPVNRTRQGRISAALGSPDESASAATDRFIRSLGMPRSLPEVGVNATDIPRLADAVMHDLWTRTNPRPLETVEDVAAFLRSAL